MKLTAFSDNGLTQVSVMFHCKFYLQFWKATPFPNSNPGVSCKSAVIRLIPWDDTE